MNIQEIVVALNARLARTNETKIQHAIYDLETAAEMQHERNERDNYLLRAYKLLACD